MTKKTVMIITIAILVVAGISILWAGSGNKDEKKENGKKEQHVESTPTKEANKNVKMGYYVLENGKNKDAKLLIQEDNKYSFGLSVFSSHLGFGSYQVDGNILVCTDKSFGSVYKFKILDNGKRKETSIAGGKNREDSCRG